MRDYNFDEIIERRHTASYKWDSLPDDSDIPMWVADMDFKTAPCIINALARRVEHGVFGYTKVPQKYYDALTSWFYQRHDWEFTAGDVIYTSGVVPAISAIIKAFTVPGDKVIVMTPAYNCFYSSIRNNGCELSANRLLLGEDGKYAIDFDDLSERAADPTAKLLILCNPHNPGGRVWSREELERIGEICISNNVTVLADEIHCELTFPPYAYTPFASISREFALHSVCCNSPSKAFNIAGLQIANIVTANDEYRAKVDRAINDNEVCDVNPFGVTGLISAYTEGYRWLEALKAYLYENYKYAVGYLKENLPQLGVMPLEGTYLLWVDCRCLSIGSERLTEMLLTEGHVMVSPGTVYGPGGEGFIRVNIAAPRALVEEGLRRIVEIIKPLLK